MAKTEAIAEDALEYLDDIEYEKLLEQTAIETNENKIVAESENKEEESKVEQLTEGIDEIANNLVANALSNAMSELEEEEAQRKAEELERESIPGLKDDVEGKSSIEKSGPMIDEKNKTAPSLKID